MPTFRYSAPSDPQRHEVVAEGFEIEVPDTAVFLGVESLDADSNRTGETTTFRTYMVGVVDEVDYVVGCFSARENLETQGTDGSVCDRSRAARHAWPRCGMQSSDHALVMFDADGCGITSGLPG